MSLPAEKSFFDVKDVKHQVNLIQQILSDVMKPDEHYGIIPGTKKPSLYKAGAEKLLFTFRLASKYHILKSVHDKNFISYTIECTLTHIPTGNFVASGIGSCNSRESKYRYRFVPSQKQPSKEEAEELKSKGLGRWSKTKNGWVWLERIENDNPWDLDNTLLKMACKRALIAATLNATASSDIFVQDYEDMQDKHDNTESEKIVDIDELNKELDNITDIDTLKFHWEKHEVEYKKCKNYREICDTYKKYKQLLSKEADNVC